MPRKLRFIPEGGAVVEVTCRTEQGRFPLKPTDELNPIIIASQPTASYYLERVTGRTKAFLD